MTDKKEQALKTLDEALAAAGKIYREAIAAAWKAYEEAKK